MKKYLIICFICFMFFNTAYAVDVYVNNEKIEFETEAFIENGRTLVPVKGIFDKMNASVIWDGWRQSVTIRDEKNIVSLIIGDNKVVINIQNIF